MKITELIIELERLRKQHGDANVEVRNAAGDWDDAEVAQAVQYEKPASKPRWVVFIDV